MLCIYWQIGSYLSLNSRRYFQNLNKYTVKSSVPNKTDCICIYIRVYYFLIYTILMTFCYPFCREFQTETSFFQKELINVLCVLICHRNDKSFNVNSVFTKLMVGKYYGFYCVSWFMWNIKFTVFIFFFTASH